MLKALQGIWSGRRDSHDDSDGIPGERSMVVDRRETPVNKCLLQTFEWHSSDDGRHYERLSSNLLHYKNIGVTSIWLPPACKAGSPRGNGYDIYDLYDLGEFDQKGSVRTKWGTKEDLLKLCGKAKECGIGLIFDAVINHKAAADRTEKCIAVEVDSKNRTKEIAEREEIEAWLGFDFAGRGDKYSAQKYHWQHFSGTDYNVSKNKEAIYKIVGGNKDWAQDVDKENGNFDYLLFADLDYSNQGVREDVKKWGVWVMNELSLEGFRIDAIKHISRGFMNEWFGHLLREFGPERPFFLCEHWTLSLPSLCEFLDQINHKISLYDPLLLTKFSDLSQAKKPDLRTVFNDTLVQARPDSAVTLVCNHDTQPGQTMESTVESWFLPLAYAMILLRQDGYPCVFHGDLHGIEGPCPRDPFGGGLLPRLMQVRKLYAYGPQKDHFDAAGCIGWTRKGTWDRPDGLAVLMSSAGSGKKKMRIGKEHSGEVWADILGYSKGKVGVNQKGFGTFRCLARGVSVFVKEDTMYKAGAMPEINADSARPTR